MEKKGNCITKTIRHYKYMRDNHNGFTMYRFLGWNKIRNFFVLRRYMCWFGRHNFIKLPTKNIFRTDIKNGNNWQVTCRSCGYTYFIKDSIRYEDTAEARSNMSKAQKGKVAWNKGVAPSKKTRKKLSEANKGKYYRKGFKHTKKSRMKLSVAMRGEKGI